MSIDPDPDPLKDITGFSDFTEGRECSTCSSDSCPGTDLIQFGKVEANEQIDEYSCFIKAELLDELSVEDTRSLLRENVLLKYIGRKTQAVTRPSSRRGSYANLGTLLVLLDDFIANSDDYELYDGMEFNTYLKTVRQVPGCRKIQNHAINHRLNENYKKLYGRDDTEGPVDRIEKSSGRGTTYKLNDSLLEPTGDADLSRVEFAQHLSEILELYFHFREYGNISVVEKCEEMSEEPLENEENIIELLDNGISHHDAREFEVASFVVLKGWYATQSVVFGESESEVKDHQLELYKTGRVNANDGGIDYVLIPVGRFFQATQNFSFDKYFLDIEKLSKFPVTFVIQTDKSSDKAFNKIEKDAKKKYDEGEVLQRYLSSFEEVFTLEDMKEILADLQDLPDDERENVYSMMMDEYARQYSVEYNIEYEFEQDLVDRETQS
jgi:hypothetical protein